MSTESNTLFQLLRDSNDTTHIPANLKRILDQIHVSYVNGTAGRILNSVADRLYYSGRYSNHPHALLMRLCALYTGHEYTPEFKLHYLTYKSEDSVLERDYNYTTQQNITVPITVHIVHVARGKTIFDEAIKNKPPTGNRNKTFESILIQNQYHYIRVYTDHTAAPQNYTTNTTPVLIITDTVNYQLIDAITNLLPHFLGLIPAYITIQDKPSDTLTDKQNLLKCIIALFNYFFKYSPTTDTGVQTHNAYITELLSEIARYAKQDHTTNLTAFTKNFSTIRSQKLLRDAQQMQDRARTDINTYTEALNKAYEKLYTAVALETQALNQNPDDITAFITMLQNNKHIEIINANQTNIQIRITAPLKYYRTEDFEFLLNNTNSVFYRHLTSDSQALLIAAIKDNKFQILMQAVIEISTTSSTTNPLSFTARCITEYMDCVPNPHLTYYNCWSAARSQLNDAITKANYDFIVPQLIAAVQSVNMAESSTFYSRFLPNFNTISEDVVLFYDPENDKKYTKKEALQLIHNTTVSEPEPTDTPKPYTQTEIEDDDDMWQDTPTTQP